MTNQYLIVNKFERKFLCNERSLTLNSCLLLNIFIDSCIFQIFSLICQGAVKKPITLHRAMPSQRNKIMSMPYKVKYKREIFSQEILVNTYEGNKSYFDLPYKYYFLIVVGKGITMQNLAYLQEQDLQLFLLNLLDNFLFCLPILQIIMSLRNNEISKTSFPPI